MGTIIVTVDAVSGDDKAEFSFDWECDREDIENAVSAVKDAAERIGVTPQQLVQSTLFYLPRSGVLQDEGAEQMQMMTIIFAILEEAGKHPENLPGPVLDVAADQDISAVITVRDNHVTMRISGKPGNDNTYVALN
jgi:hypothetical protein